MQQHGHLRAERRQHLYAVAALAVAIGCGHAAPHAPGPSSTPTAPTTITSIAKPNGLAWDTAHARLLVADDATMSIVPWTDAGAGTPIAIVPSPADKDGLGGIALAPGGDLLVAHFGGGTAGGIVRVAGGAVAPIAGLDPARRRLGVSVARDGAIVAVWFVRGSDKGKQAGVERIDPSGAVSDLVTGLDKPVGVLVDGDRLWISDQGAGTVSRCTLPACTDVAVVAHVDGPDLLAAAPGGGVLVASGHDLARVDDAGAVTAIAHGLDRPRGIAVDAAGKRVFVADRAAVRILPLP